MICPRHDGYLAECVLGKAHYEPHVFKTPEGKYIAWKDDMECGCCEPEEDDRCCFFWEISERQAAEMAAHPFGVKND